MSSVLWLVKSDKVERRVSNSQQREQRVANPSQEKKAEETGRNPAAVAKTPARGAFSPGLPPPDPFGE